MRGYETFIKVFFLIVLGIFCYLSYYVGYADGKDSVKIEVSK